MPRTARETLLQEDIENDHDPWQDRDIGDLASVLEDFLDEEVVDRHGMAIGTLACYWQSINGSMVFLGVKLEGQESIHIVPGRRSQVDDRGSCIRLGLDADAIEDAPCFDSALELDATMERTVQDHFDSAGSRTSRDHREPANS